MKIPTRFKAVNIDYTVMDMDDDTMNATKAYGMTDVDGGTIKLRPTIEMKKIRHTWYHELLHVVFNAIGRGELNNDEDLIDAMAGVMDQIDQTSKGNLYGSKKTEVL
jgi:hypothetical protein